MVGVGMRCSGTHAAKSVVLLGDVRGAGRGVVSLHSDNSRVKGSDGLFSAHRRVVDETHHCDLRGLSGNHHSDHPGFEGQTDPLHYEYLGMALLALFLQALSFIIMSFFRGECDFPCVLPR